jgi:hypothetical protein
MEEEPMRWSDRKSMIRNRSLGQLLGGVGVATLGLAALTTAYAGSTPPKQLYGKSVIVSWTESRSQRAVGEQAFRPMSVNLQRSVYVSTAGRVFARTSAGATSGRRSVSGAAESVGTTGTNFSGGAHNVQFQGNSIIMTGGFTASARRVMINFDNSFESCTAQAITAKEVGAKIAVWRGIGSGRLLEVESVSAGPASCSVRSGNVFAE